MSRYDYIELSLEQRNALYETNRIMIENANRAPDWRTFDIRDDIMVPVATYAYPPMSEQDRAEIEELFRPIPAAPKYPHPADAIHDTEHDVIRDGTESKPCVVCLTNTKRCINLPCGHVTTCIGCTQTNTVMVCFICRRNLTEIKRMFT
jgi:hypothetical protein